MNKTFIIFISLFISFSLFTGGISLIGATYYVATTGNDNSSGTFDQPWATWQKAFDEAQSGDTIYIRGGEYGIWGNRVAASTVAYAYQKNGTILNPIRIWAYPGENPVLNCDTISRSVFNGLYLQSCSNWHIKGLTVKNNLQPLDGSIQAYGFQFTSCSNITIENCIAHDIEGPGFKPRSGTGYMEFINCDSYNNFDPYTPIPGNNADGFCSYENENTIDFLFRGCRAWNNSDDGFDTWMTLGVVTFESCWSFNNGYWVDGPAGVGFKLGAVTSSQYARILTNCIAFGNKNVGIGRNSVGFAKMKLFNNTVIGNGYGIDMRCNIGNETAIIRNNISFDNIDPWGREKNFQTDTLVIDDHNSWNDGVTFTYEDFLNTDPLELLKDRKSDGSLPDINFMKLAPGSDLIDAGIDIGLPFSGTAPDIGAFESSSDPYIPNPIIISASVEQATPSQVELIYDLVLAVIAPDPSAFSVRVNGITRIINAVAVSGNKVLLTLDSPVVYGDVVTISYDLPSSNPLQTPEGGMAASVSDRPVRNNISPTEPHYVSSVIENAAPTIVELTFDVTLANIIPSPASFVVNVNSTARTISAVAISESRVRLTLASAVIYGDIITVAYTKPATNPIQAPAGGQAATFAARPVTNNVSMAVPVYLRSAVENTTPSRLEMVYNLPLANVVPPASAFSVLVNGINRPVNSVAIVDGKVHLTLAGAIVYDDVVTVAYTKPEINPLQTSNGGTAVSISAQPVTNGVIRVNNAPVIVVSADPYFYAGFIGEINAAESNDPDNDNLTFAWSIPDNIPVSATNGAMIQFLSPVMNNDTTVEFTLTVSDGGIAQSRSIPVEIKPYKPELKMATIEGIEASDFIYPNYPKNTIDGNIETMWTADGGNQWLLLPLKESFAIHHVLLAFQPDQGIESYFDILASADNVTWELILDQATSCNFSGDLQVFDFPVSKTGKAFSSLKLLARGNSMDTWNYISEFRAFGYPDQNATISNDPIIIIYPNPASKYIDISIWGEESLMPDYIRIIDYQGKTVLEENIDFNINELHLPINLTKGIYFVQLRASSITWYNQKLVVQ